MGTGKDTGLASPDKEDREIVPGTFLSSKQKLLLEIEEGWVKHSIPKQRETTGILLRLIGFFFGFYAVTFSLSIGSGLLDRRQLAFFWKLIGLGPLFLWVGCIFVCLFLLTPAMQKMGGDLKGIERTFNLSIRRIGVLLKFAIMLFALGVLWFLVNLCIIFMFAC